jgi:hypothetical protein
MARRAAGYLPLSVLQAVAPGPRQIHWLEQAGRARAMTVFLRALYGPFHRKTDEVYTADGWLLRGPRAIDWHFFGIRENNTVGRWSIRFDVEKRKFLVVNYPMGDKPALPDRLDAFVLDKPMVHGPTYLAILKAHLSKDDIAFASRLALEAVRR